MDINSNWLKRLFIVVLQLGKTVTTVFKELERNSISLLFVKSRRCGFQKKLALNPPRDKCYLICEEKRDGSIATTSAISSNYAKGRI